MTQSVFPVSEGVKVLRDYGISCVAVDPCGDAEGNAFIAHKNLD